VKLKVHARLAIPQHVRARSIKSAPLALAAVLAAGFCIAAATAAATRKPPATLHLYGRQNVLGPRGIAVEVAATRSGRYSVQGFVSLAFPEHGLVRARPRRGSIAAGQSRVMRLTLSTRARKRVARWMRLGLRLYAGARLSFRAPGEEAGTGFVSFAVHPPHGFPAPQRPRRAAEPAHGAPNTTFVVRYRSTGAAEGGDQIHLRGPAHTRCAGELLYQPTGELPGQQTIYLTPGVRDSARGRVYHLSPTENRSFRPRRLTSWCAGYYAGSIEYEDEVDSASSTLIARFWFRVG
jgi:hypothetical protein